MSERESKESFHVRLSSGVVITDDDGRILLLRHSNIDSGGWSLPAGRMKPHEDPFKTALRETKEETGLDVEVMNLIGIYPIDRGDELTSVGFVFSAKLVSGDLIPDGDEIVECRYFSIAECQKLIQDKMFYKPEFNVRAITNFVETNLYPIEVIKRYIKISEV